jgi:general transcription factor 3C protein 4
VDIRNEKETIDLLLFLCRSSRPSDFSYKHDAKHSNMLIVAQMWDEHNDELYLYKLSRLLNTVKTCMIPL